jgi:hypothetical protein
MKTINSSLEAFEFYLEIQAKRKAGMSAQEAYAILKDMANKYPDYSDTIMTGIHSN